MTTTQQAPAQNVRLMKHYVTNGTTKARVWYSRGERFITPGQPETQDAVTIRAKEYGHELARIFGAELYENGTDIMTDYFEKGRVVITAEHPLFAQACARAQR